MEEITAKLVLSQEEIAYIWHGGTLAVKIDAPDMKVSLDLSTTRTSDSRRQSVRIKRVPGKTGVRLREARSFFLYGPGLRRKGSPTMAQLGFAQWITAASYIKP